MSSSPKWHNTMRLKHLLVQLGLQQTQLARAVGYSPAAIAQLLNHGIWPRNTKQCRLRMQMATWLEENGATEEQLDTAFQKWTPAGCDLSASDTATSKNEEDPLMLLRKQSLTPLAKRHFGLARDPFGEVQDASEVYANEAIRYARLSMLDKAKHGGMLAVVGESGAGKSTLRRDLIERVHREGLPIRVIQPYVLAMGDTDAKGTPLRALNIVEAILSDVAPTQRLRQSHEARFRQVHEALRESFRAGNRHVLIIEEAHAMPMPTIKALKRFVELEEGFSRLLSVVLIGQTELAAKLSEQNAEVREVVQRCEVITLPPLDESLEDYLKFRLKAVDADLSKLIDETGVAALRERLTRPGPKGHTGLSLLYPLAVHNLLTAALNLGAELGARPVTGDIVAEV